MSTLILACEVLRPELEMLARALPKPPVMLFMEQRLHDYPDRLREAAQEKVDAHERESRGPARVVFGYGLCGRALCGVHAKRATLIFPRVHDCIPLLLGLGQKAANASSREGATYWITPGWLESFLIEFHLESHKRFAVYEKKFGPVKAARMVKAENALLANYKNACHIRWPEMGESYVETARKVAENTQLTYTEAQGHSGYLNALLQGGDDQSRFIHLLPGQTIDMDMEGEIIAMPCGQCTAS